MCWASSVFSQWAEIADVQINKVQTELGGAAIGIKYELKAANASTATPVYVFIRCSIDQTPGSWLIQAIYKEMDLEW